MTRRNIPHEDVLKRWMQDPEFKTEYDALEPAYQVACRRIEQGLTQAELAEMVNTRQPSIARLESGKRDPHLSFLRRVATALGCRLEVRLVPQEKLIEASVLTEVESRV